MQFNGDIVNRFLECTRPLNSMKSGRLGLLESIKELLIDRPLDTFLTNDWKEMHYQQ